MDPMAAAADAPKGPGRGAHPGAETESEAWGKVPQPARVCVSLGGVGLSHLNFKF